MSKKTTVILLFLIIFIAACFVRLYKLGEIPAGVYLDEASLGYNAYSLLLTGRDEFGKSWPIYFRAFSTFQDSLYGYFSVIPVYLFGLSVFSTRLVSAISGLAVVLVTFFLFYSSELKNRVELALIASLTVALAPWSIYQSRVAVGSNLGLGLTSIAILFLALSLKKKWFFMLSCFIFGIASYAYAGQRITGILFPAMFALINKKAFLHSKKFILTGFALLVVVMLPQFLGLFHTGSLIRYQTQGYSSQGTFERFGGSLTKVPFIGRPLYIARQFTSQYLSDFSPRSLFYEPEPQLVRSIPNLSVFYIWMVIPFFIGFSELWKRRSNTLIQIVFLLMLIGVIPEALTGDPFYTLRFLPALWGMTIMIALGIKAFFDRLKFINLKVFVATALIVFSIVNLYISYFILLKHERSVWYGYPFEVLAQITEKNKDQKYVLDSETYDAPYIWMAFYKKYDPAMLQSQTPTGLLEHYYDDLTFYKYRSIGNVAVRKIDWGEDQCRDEYIVSDITAVSPAQAQEHKFTLEQEIKDLNEKTVLWIYKTNPKLSCPLSRGS